ncbi:MAG: hypothetical protein GC192_05395 [Bacteroidetes bacterium]|nr:hypothetical protein [Bacteroidota bacterium]
MKVGYTFVNQLALKAFAFTEAIVKFLFFVLLLLTTSKSLLAADDPISTPFQLVGNTMLVQAAVNNQVGIFLFDTGSSDLILNSAYYEGKDEHSEVMGLYGQVLNVQHLVAYRIEIAGVNIAKDMALVLDLSALEKLKKMPIAGILGYNVLKNYELQIDFQSQQIMLFKLKNNGRRSADSPYTSADAFDFKMSGHIPYLEMKLGDKLVRMGIDSGSERNILQPEMLDLQQFEPIGHLKLAGLSQQVIRQEKGYIHDVSLGDHRLEKLEVILTDLQAVSKELPIALHGILGIQFLKEYKVAINYKLRKIYLWQPKAGASECQLAVCEM